MSAEGLHAALTALVKDWGDFEHDAVACSDYRCPDCTMLNAIHDAKTVLAEHMPDALLAEHAPTSEPTLTECTCTPYTIRTDYGTGIEHDVDRSGCPVHEPETTLTEDERAALDQTDSEHDYPTETDDGLVMRCRCGSEPPSHYLGQQVDEALWLWEHRRRERHAAVERILRDRLAAVEADRNRWQRRADQNEEWWRREDARAQAAEAKVAALRQQVDDLTEARDLERFKYENAHRGANIYAARAQAAEQTVVAQAQVIKQVRALADSHDKPKFMPEFTGWMPTGVVRSILDAAPAPPAQAEWPTRPCCPSIIAGRHHDDCHEDTPPAEAEGTDQ